MNKCELKKHISEVLIKENKIKHKFTFIKNDIILLNLVEKYTNFLHEKSTISERIYCILNDITELQICKECGNLVVYCNFSSGYREFCSKFCMNNSNETKLKKKETRSQEYIIDKNILEEISSGLIKYSIDELKLWLLNNAIGDDGSIYQYYGISDWFEFKFPHEDNCIKHYTSFLDESTNISERIYCILNDIKEPQICISCGNKVNYNGRMTKGYARFCSTKCSANNNETRNKYANTCIDIYGVSSPLQNDYILDKLRNTNIIKYGVPYVYMSKEIQNAQISNNIINYGVEYTFQRDDVKLKCIESYINNFGVDNPMKDYNIFIKNQKSGYKLKEYISPDNKSFFVQGYEPFALKYLIEELGYNSNDIIVGKEVPVINYTFENKEHKYYPDIYIISEKTLVEVKSDWTYELHFERNKIKQISSKENNYKHLILIFNKKGEITEII